MPYSILCTSVKCLVAPKQRFIDRKKAKFFGSLVFFILLLSACAMPAGDGKNVKRKVYLESSLDQEQALDPVPAPAPAKQVINNKDAHFVLSSDAFANVRSSIGGAQLNELGDKIPIALTETAINKTENLINQQANEMANSVGYGKTQISLRQLATKTPDFSIRTIQPLTDLTDQSTQLTFTQAQISSGENHGERRATINLGIGQRYLLEDGQSIAGINLFTDYEAESKHSRASLGLEYRRANFSANVNQYYPLSNKVVIGDYTEEPLAGYDIRLTGQVPYLPWAKIKGTQYYWDAITGDNIKGTSLGIEANINAATTFEIGTENSNTASRSGYAQLRIQYPYNTAPTQFIIANSAFEDSNRLSLTDLTYVERSNKIRIEKLLNSVGLTLGAYNATTVGATCTLFNASHVAIPNGSGVTGSDGMVNLSNVVIPTGFIYSKCTGGYYDDEATGISTPAPHLHAGMIYSGTGNVILVPSPLSEIAYQLAGTNLASTIAAKNAEVATAFGLNSVDIISTIPTDINTTKAENDDAGKFATVLAAISQMGKNSDDANPTVTINALVADMQGTDGSAIGTIEGRSTETEATGTEVVDITKAIRNFETNSGANKDVGTGTGAANIDLSTGEGSVIGDLAIAFIDAYDGTNTAPTVLQYADAGVTGVTVNNLAAVNAAVANQPAGTTALIQALADTGITTANANVAGSVAITGTATQHQTLTAIVSDDDGVTAGTITYQWQRTTNSVTTNIGTNGTSAAYVLVQADVGSTITVVAQYTDGDGVVGATATSSATNPVTNANVAGSVAISGTATQGQTLEATVSDDDGVTGTITYQWQRTTNSVTTNIGTNGTSAAYVLVQADVGSTITVFAQYTDGDGVAGATATSSATNPVTNANVAGSVAITGTATQHQTLTAIVSDDDGVTAGTITYQWQRTTNSVTTNIGTNGTSAAYVLVQADVGSTITVFAQYTDGDGVAGATATSSATDAVEAVVMIVDGVTYSTVQIGGQIWTASNVSIAPTLNNVENTDYWTTYGGSQGTSGDNDGYYYTWNAAMTVCTNGWRLPSDSDFGALFVADLIERTAFNAKLAGQRNHNAGAGESQGFYYRGEYAFWWSSTINSTTSNPLQVASYHYLKDWDNTHSYNDGFNMSGNSVRCLKDI